MDWRVTRFPILASTNDLALQWMRGGLARSGDVFVADEQTSGRGRPGRSWHSAKGALLCTAVLPFYPERAGWAALAAGIAVAQAVRELGAPAGVKWPNDVVLHGRKLAGILVETSTPELAAVGIGLNVSNPLPADPAVAARSARLADSVEGAEVEPVLGRILEHLAHSWELLETADVDALLRSWAGLDTTAGRRVRWSEGDLPGVAEGVERDGALRFRSDAGEVHTARVGEILFL